MMIRVTGKLPTIIIMEHTISQETFPAQELLVESRLIISNQIHSCTAHFNIIRPTGGQGRKNDWQYAKI